MANEITDDIFAGYGPSEQLVSGLTVTGSFLPQLTLGSKGFQVKYNREIKPLLDAQRRPITSISVVLVGLSPHVSRAYYADDYKPNAAEQVPDCASDDGVSPNPSVSNPQAKFCADCPMNAWGSTRRPGSRAKACREFKRIAIASVADLDCEAFGAPLLFSVPPASHASLDQLYRALKVLRLPEWAAAVTLEYDLSRAYPAVTFAVERRLELDELARARRLMTTFHARLARSFGVDEATYALPPCPPVIEQAAAALPPLDVRQGVEPLATKPALAAPKSTTKSAPQPMAKSTSKPTAKPEPAPVEDSAVPWIDDEEEDDIDIDSIFNKLRNER
jgi:hypothetical protein